MDLKRLPELPYASGYSCGLSAHIKPHSGRPEKSPPIIFHSPPLPNIKYISVTEINTVSMPDGVQMVIKMQDTANEELNE